MPIGHGAGKPYPLGPTLVSTTRANNLQDVRCTLNFAVSETGRQTGRQDSVMLSEVGREVCGMRAHIRASLSVYECVSVTVGEQVRQWC